MTEAIVGIRAKTISVSKENTDIPTETCFKITNN